jgi:hypothetical protein
LYVLQTTPGVIASGVASLQSGGHGDEGNSGSGGPGACRSAIASGVYGFISQGTGAQPTVLLPATGPLTGIRTVSFSPQGSFRLIAARNANGLIDPQPLNLSGSYTFAQDCNFRMVFDAVGFHFKGHRFKGRQRGGLPRDRFRHHVPGEGQKKRNIVPQ